MTATNHIVTGALIASAIHNPAVALPAALLSHFVLDALPHFGQVVHMSKEFLTILVTDMVIGGSILSYLVLRQPEHWILMVGCGVVAASPDLMWLPRFWKQLNHKKVSKRPVDPITRFHRRIQWFERPWGLGIEVLWFVGILIALGLAIA